MKNNLRCFILGMRYIAKLLLNSLWGKSIFQILIFPNPTYAQVNSLKRIFKHIQNVSMQVKLING